MVATASTGHLHVARWLMDNVFDGYDALQSADAIVLNGKAVNGIHSVITVPADI